MEIKQKCLKFAVPEASKITAVFCIELPKPLKPSHEYQSERIWGFCIPCECTGAAVEGMGMSGLADAPKGPFAEAPGSVFTGLAASLGGVSFSAGAPLTALVGALSSRVMAPRACERGSSSFSGKTLLGLGSVGGGLAGTGTCVQFHNQSEWPFMLRDMHAL